MENLRYERLVIGYHGCDRDIRDQVLAGKRSLKSSENDYDWLGKGTYFWEYGPDRALEWAKEQKKRNRLDNPAVIGALMYLGNCFDLLDVQYTRFLAQAYPEFVKTLETSGTELPQNAPAKPTDPEFLLRRRDCAVMNWSLERFEEASKLPCHTVRGLFQEGKPAFPGSYIQTKSHIQIAVRDTSCILGYFLPR
jgi:hypothetical protein